MSECSMPDHIFLQRKNTFKICIYHKGSKSKPSLYCVTNNEEYPISIELLNKNNKPLTHNRNGQQIWCIMNNSSKFIINHSHCEFQIKFTSMPSYQDQPLKFRFKSTSNNNKIQNIQPFTTQPFRVMYV